MTRYLFILILLVISLGKSIPSHANDYCPPSLERMPTLAGGRIKPLRVHAQDVFKFMTGKKDCGTLSATQAYCQLSLEAIIAIPSECRPEIRVNHKDTRALLEMAPDTQTISPANADTLLTSLQNTYSDLQAQKKEHTALGKDIAATIQKINVYLDIHSGADWQLPVVIENKPHWVNPRDLHLIKQEHFADSTQFLSLLDRLKTVYDDTMGRDYLLELTYDKLHLFSWAMLASLVGLGIATVVPRHKRWPFLLATVPVLMIEIAAIAFRVLISGRGPVTNMYETVVWVGLGTLFFATALSFIRREKLYLLAGLSLNLLCLFMVNFAHSMLDPSISPLVPVLRDNFWLSTHVTTVTISYAAFALSWGLANYYMIKRLISKSPANLTAETQRINQLVYDAIKIGVVLISAGVILGGIWADYSWGRFWGWDPKETWSLIVLLAYIAILHGRRGGWIPRHYFIPLVAGAFLTVLMAWFGVNYILATGLHSYGFSEGGTFFIAALVVTQLVLVGIYLIRYRDLNSGSA